MFKKKIKVSSLNELKRFAKKFSTCLKGNELILLVGDLGSGKTTFTKFLISAIDPHVEEEVNSPTFSVMNLYETEKFPIYHIDLYRVKGFDISDIVNKGLIIIEWPNEEISKIEEVPTVILKFDIHNENKRIIEINLVKSDYVKQCI